MWDQISRRTFFKKTGVIGATGLIGLKSSPVISSDDLKSSVIAVITGDPDKAVARAVEILGGFDKFIPHDSQILLKPNISFPNPAHWGSTTNPDVVKAVAALAVQSGAKRVIIADNTMQDSELCFEKTGFNAAFSEDDAVKLIQLNRESFFTEIDVPGGKALKSVKIAKLIGKCDVLINMPCAKSHAATEVSFGLKNLMGLVWDRKFFHTGTDLHTGIAELATVIRPQLTILDATRALLTAGPTGPGKVQELHTIIAGTDPLTVDAYATSMVPWNRRSLSAQSVTHLNHAATLGLGKIDLNKITIIKETV
ncbi:MAG: DUF362 domain-containing protein [Candidatus Latescibacteria bacterium]|nr:DUF362 domain-containing protein [Candidatus Latescibacterota bacterium]